MESIVFATATPVLFRDFEGVAGLFPNLVLIHDDTCPTASGTKTRILCPRGYGRHEAHVTSRHVGLHKLHSCRIHHSNDVQLLLMT